MERLTGAKKLDQVNGPFGREFGHLASEPDFGPKLLDSSGRTGDGRSEHLEFGAIPEANGLDRLKP